MAIDLIDRSDCELKPLTPEQLAAIIEIERRIQPQLNGMPFACCIHALVDLAVQGAGLSSPPMPEGYLHNLVKERFEEYRRQREGRPAPMIIPVPGGRLS